jgi:uncharacterized membrane protein
MRTTDISLYQKKITFFLVIVLFLGIFFRFFNIERKFYWYDEVFTSLRISGYTEAAVIQQVARGQVVDLESLKKYQTVNSETSISKTIKGLATEEPQHPPLYYVAVRLFAQIFGDSVKSIRSFSAILSLLAFPCIYWLCLELFNSSLVGWLALTIIAISPFHILYAQEARAYSLWTGLILLSSAVFLRAMRLKTVLSWVWYSITLAIGLYCFPLTGLVAIGHGIYATIVEKFRILDKNIRAYFLSCLAAFLLFIPWIWLAFSNLPTISHRTNWSTNYKQPLSVLARNWAVGISRLFFDINTRHDSQFSYRLLMGFVTIAILALFFYSLYFLVKISSGKICWFVLTLIGTTALSIVMPDLLLGGIRSTKDRYLIPSYLGIQIAIAYLLAMKIGKLDLRKYSQKFWQVITIILICLGIISNLVSAQLDNWWLKETGYQNPAIARVINQLENPLIVSDISSSQIANVISLSYLLKPQAKFQLVQNAQVPDIPKNFSNIFIYGTSGELRSQLEQLKNFKIMPVYQEKEREIWLWKVANT